MIKDDRMNPEATRKRRFFQIKILLLLVVAGAFALYRLNLKSKLSTRIASVRAVGYPVTGAELSDWYAIFRGAENAADIILDAAKYYFEPYGEMEVSVLWARRGRGTFLPVRTRPLSERTVDLVGQYLTQNKSVLELLHKGIATPHSRYPVDFCDVVDSELDYHHDVDNCAKLLNLEAIYHAENDNPAMAARSVTASFGLARSVGGLPILASQDLRTHCNAVAVTTLRRVINHAEFTDEQLIKLGRVVADAQNLSYMSRAFAGERCIRMHILKSNKAMRPELIAEDRDVALPLAQLYMFLYKFSGLADKDKIAYLDLMGEYNEAARLPLHERQKAFEVVQAKTEAKSRRHVLLHLLMPMVSRAIDREENVLAQLQTAQVAIAVRRYCLAEGRLPDAIDHLVPDYLEAVPTDPNGRKLRYKKCDTGCIVYRIMRDAKDDDDNKGRVLPKGSSFTFTLEYHK